MIRFAADSSCDLPKIAGMEVSFVPMIISTNERSFTDNAHLNVTEMLDYLASYKGRSYTACPSVDSWMTTFEGADEVYAVTITSGLSGSYNAAMAARELYLHDHPDTKIAVFDSLSTGPEMLLILEMLKTLTDQGLPFEEVEARVREYQQHIRLFFSLQSLHNLSQNGRVSKVAAAAVGVLGIRIVGTASPEGTLAQLGKCRGDRKAIPELMAYMTEAGYEGGKVRITHVENPELAEKYAAAFRERWPDADIAISANSGLCSYYAERGAVLIGIETK
ncbi:MAG: DegV family protein [Faecousia sp.]